ncbi:hypothetical protein, unknown function [Leishmania infantum JPCM5]|uniref:Uncharacterized protein n=2 Tax=Leishmania infantum TaxID=5671 RepID=A4HUU0_LEIIN|nr:hypothetical protein, unknown function [Leishmania infantum JPCM5]CAC9460030.1 hypothetical_protein_-_conserved [Leishmania infantum]CAM66201.1 hypothetical protein, unknown function [Leishmania infantum JPCM5]SUZ39809.1 hypothetical_protein_-_conserved [Leishmania infantum]|eukprot:XP_001463831.1 hypothetical protein, unknown function [Leishmania infantum JPCM5]
MLRQCERLIVQLSQQVLEQEKDIRSLRAALHSSPHRQRRDRQRGGDEKRERAAAVSTAESFSVSAEGRRHHHAHHITAKAPTQRKMTHEDPRLCLTLPSPTTPQVSPINSSEDAGVDSTTGPYPEATVVAPHSPQSSGAGSAVPSPTRSASKSSGQHGMAVALAFPSIVCDVSSFSDKANVGLTPSTVCDRPPSGEAATADALWASSLLSEQERSSSSSSLARHPRNTAQRTRNAQFETPRVKFDNQDAMSYLLSVFSSVKSTREADGGATAAMAEVGETAPCGREHRGGAGVRSPNAPLQRQGEHVARRLFRLDPVDEDEGSESGNEHSSGGAVSDYDRPAARRPFLPPSRDKRCDGDGSAPPNHKTCGSFDEDDAFLQERYARIVACALAAEFTAFTTLVGEDEVQQQRGCKTGPRTPTAARCRTTSRRDHSTSATVSELLQLFTFQPATRHQPDSDGKGL